MLKKRKKTMTKRIGLFHYNSPVILTYVLLSFVALGLSWATNGFTNTLLFSVYPCSWIDPFGYIRLVGHVVGHANFEHYFSNILIILLVGPMLEEKYGSWKLLIMLLATAMISGLLYKLFAPAGVAALGASGVVFMLIILSSFVNLQQGRLPLTLVFAVVFYLGREIFYSVTEAQPGVANIMHILGGICGGIIGYVVQKKK